MPIYGEMLAYFPELVQPHVVYTMRPQTIGGYGPHEKERKVNGILLLITPGAMGSEKGRTEQERGVFFVQIDADTPKIVQGDFVDYEGVPYLLMKPSHAENIGGFIHFVLHEVIPPNGTKLSDRGVNLGAYEL